MTDPNAPKPCAICGDVHLIDILPEGSKWEVIELPSTAERWGLVPPDKVWPINIQPTWEMAQHYFPIVIQQRGAKWQTSKPGET